MLHSKAGNGKTFIVLDMALHIASGKSDWFGSKVRNGFVVYLAGEGHSGLSSRMKAWDENFKPENKVNFLMSRYGTDLDTAYGLALVSHSIRKLPEKPVLIVVDTLHRFLSGDENSSQDANKMLKNCEELTKEFGCAVLFVHHTGNDADKQGRARGSSAWRGAVETDISIQRKDDNGPISIQVAYYLPAIMIQLRQNQRD